jgi:hypothetical protein
MCVCADEQQPVQHAGHDHQVHQAPHRPSASLHHHGGWNCLCVCLHWQVRVVGVRGGGDYICCFFRLASKTTDVNWTKAKDLGDHMGYYNNRWDFREI